MYVSIVCMLLLVFVCVFWHTHAHTYKCLSFNKPHAGPNFQTNTNILHVNRCSSSPNMLTSRLLSFCDITFQLTKRWTLRLRKRFYFLLETSIFMYFSVTGFMSGFLCSSLNERKFYCTGRMTQSAHVGALCWLLFKLLYCCWGFPYSS